MREAAEEERVNPWFKKAATILSVNSRINIQKSFWRMKLNMNTAGVTFNAAIIVKLKKMYNRWLGILENTKLYERCKVLTQFFDISSKA